MGTSLPMRKAQRQGKIMGDRMKKYLLLFWIAMAICGAGIQAQSSIPQDSASLAAGEGMGVAVEAEMNGFPGPKHVLDLKDKLGLTKDQIRKAENLVKLVGISASAKGNEIIEAEQELHGLFVSGKINEKLLRMKLENIGKLRGELRFIHMQAHLKMKQILNPDQIQQYYESQSREAK
jgi:Spy/CpxP family protein refolding chaperone